MNLYSSCYSITEALRNTYRARVLVYTDKSKVLHKYLQLLNKTVKLKKIINH